MPWNTLASNQAVSFNNLQDAVNTGIFTAKTTIPVSTECITKTDANTYVNINTSYPSYAAKASNQLVVKSNLTSDSAAAVDITNSTAGTDITNITINGVQVDGAVFPIIAGDGASASTTQTGASRTIVVSYTNVSNDSVEVIDTASNLTCISATSTSRVFAGQVVSVGGTVTISMFDGSC
jgi:hypothetical protein